MRLDDLTIREAVSSDADAIAPLFDAYRQFYGKASDLDLARAFLRQRLGNAESIVLVAVSAAGAEPLGFVQLYPTFSSLQCNRAWVLNDLFVAERARRHGVAEALMQAAARSAQHAGVSSISLSTAHGNVAAQRLYTKLGYMLDEDFRTYVLTIKRLQVHRPTATSP
jgi:ribosomal protein S18 acetylase RimI-like enzyme